MRWWEDKKDCFHETATQCWVGDSVNAEHLSIIDGSPPAKPHMGSWEQWASSWLPLYASPLKLKSFSFFFCLNTPAPPRISDVATVSSDGQLCASCVHQNAAWSGEKAFYVPTWRPSPAFCTLEPPSPAKSGGSLKPWRDLRCANTWSLWSATHGRMESACAIF